MVHPGRVLKQLCSKQNDAEISDCLAKLSTSLLMENELVLLNFDAKQGVEKVARVLERAISDKAFGDTVAMSFRVLSLILEHVPHSYTAFLKFRDAIVNTVSIALHAALCMEWKHSHTDTTMLVEEGLRLLRLAAIADASGSILQQINVSDLLTFCAVGEAHTIRSALEALHTICSKMVLPAEVDSNLFSNLLSLFRSFSDDSLTSNSTNPIVVSVEQVLSPFLSTLLEQLVQIVITTPDIWPRLELVLLSIGEIMMRAQVSRRSSTGKAVVSANLVKHVFELMLRLEESKPVDNASHARKIILCETVLWRAANCHPELFIEIMTSTEAQRFWEAFLSHYTVENSSLLDDPFESTRLNSGQKIKGDKESLTVLAGLHMFVLACSDIPSAVFGPDFEEFFPIHRWTWSDHRHEKHSFNEEQCARFENAYSRAETKFSFKAYNEAVKVDVHAMVITTMPREIRYPIERSFVPFAFQLVKEKSLRHVGNAREASLSYNGLSTSATNFASLSSFLVEQDPDPCPHTLSLAETYFELLVQFSLKKHSDLVRTMSIRVFASLLRILLLSKKEEHIRILLISNIQSICVLLDESLLCNDSVTTSILLAVIKWLFLKDSELKLFFCAAFDRFGLLQKLQTLRNTMNEKGANADKGKKTTLNLCSALCQAIPKKLSTLHLRSSIPFSEVEQLSVIVEEIKGSAAVPGLYPEKMERLFQSLSGSTSPTVFEICQMNIAKVLLSYLLDGKTMEEVVGRPIVFCTEGFASSWNHVSCSVENSILTADDDEPSFLPSITRRSSPAVSTFINMERLENVVNIGLTLPLGFCKLIHLLTSALSLGLHLPSVESLAFSSEKIVCKTPSKAFLAMSECCSWVRMCSSPRTQTLMPTPSVPLTSQSPFSNSKRESRRNRKNVSADLKISNFRRKATVQQPASRGCQEHAISKLSYSSESVELDLRSHLLTTIGDIERLLRTGNASPFTSMCDVSAASNERMPFLLRAVEFFLKDTAGKRPDSKEGKVAFTLLSAVNRNGNSLLATLVSHAIFLSSNTVTESSVKKRAALPPFPLNFPLPPAERDIAMRLIEEGLSRRFSLFRPYSGYCNYHETLFGLLFQEAYKSGNIPLLFHLEEILCISKEGEDSNRDTFSDVFLYCGTSCSCGNGAVKKTGADALRNFSPISSFGNSSRSHYTFHCFEGSSTPGKCRCGEYQKEAFYTDWGDDLALRLPPIAYREDIALLSIFHQYLHREGNNTIKLLGDESLFISSHITSHVVQAVAKSALRVALLPAKLALPRWVMFVFENAKFLIPISVREKLCRFLACGARRALLENLRRKKSLKKASLIPISDLRYPSLHKFSVSRCCLLQDAMKVLRESADSRFPVSMEFEGDVGVGQGPTAQFYTLLSQKISQKSLNLWNDTPRDQLNGNADLLPSGGANGIKNNGIGGDVGDELVVPPLEGLFPIPESIGHVSHYPEKETAGSRIIISDRIANLLDKMDFDKNEESKLYYTTGMALGRAFLDGYALPLFLSTAIFFFLRFEAPPLRVAVSEKEIADGIELPIDLYNLAENDIRMVDQGLMKSIKELSGYSEKELASLKIPFSLPGNDNFELVNNGSEEFVTEQNLKKYQHRVAASVLYESVARAIQLITAGFFDVVPRDALRTMSVQETSKLLCGEFSSLTEPLWTLEEIQAVLVGNHGYQKDSPQITMLAEVLSKKFSPAEQQAFLFFISGCPRLPLGGIRALGVITVVKRSDIFYPERDLEGISHLETSEEEKENFSPYSPNSEAEQRDDQARASFSDFEISTSRLIESDWPLPSVNTCFRYLKLPPYPTVDLMHKKLLLSITQSGGTFELS